MTIVRQSVKTFLFITITTAITLFVMVQRNNKTNQPVFSASIPVVITPVQTEAFNYMDSPDGTMTLKLISNSLFVSSKSDGQERQIYKNEEINSHNLEIPFNTWSPDNVYIFLKEKTPSINNYLVFQSSGNLFSNNLPYMSIQELFKINVPNYSITDVTGWAAPNLLIINTKLIGETVKTGNF